MTKHVWWQWAGGVVGVVALAAAAASCGGSGGGSGDKGNPQEQFVLNSSNAGRLVLNVSPAEVDANKADRIGLVATLTDPLGNPIVGIAITFTSDIPDIRFLPTTTTGLVDRAIAVTDAQGNADIIAVAGSTPTGTGAIIGTGAIFATAPTAFSLVAQARVTLTDVGFIDADSLGVIPSSIAVGEPRGGQVLFFNIVGGIPPYLLKNEVDSLGTAAIGQHCTLGCTDRLCIGSPCLDDTDCNLGGSSTPSLVCIGPIGRCIASCVGTNCGGSRCENDADCNDGSPLPANVCQDAGQAIVYIIGESPDAGAGTTENVAVHTFQVEDSGGSAVDVTVTANFFCGNGEARGTEQCDTTDFRGNTCEALGFDGGALLCNSDCTFDTSNCGFTTPTPIVTPGP